MYDSGTKNYLFENDHAEELNFKERISILEKLKNDCSNEIEFSDGSDEEAPDEPFHIE